MLKHEHAVLLTVLGPSTALPGFRAPPTPGFSPRIHTRCFKKKSEKLQGRRRYNTAVVFHMDELPAAWPVRAARRCPEQRRDSGPNLTTSAYTGCSLQSADTMTRKYIKVGTI